MSMYALLRSQREALSEEEIEDALGGNLWCVCTLFEGQYHTIITVSCSCSVVRGA